MHPLISILIFLASPVGQPALFTSILAAGNGGTWLAILTPLGVLVTAWVTWKVAARKSSGTVKTSQSDELWKAWSDLQAAADQLREDMNQTIIDLRAENQDLRAQLADVKARLAALEGKGGRRTNQ